MSFFAHYVRSYRHPNLEELLFSGPATAGNIVPNVTVKPETGHNVDVGTRVPHVARVRLAVVLQQHVSRLHLDGSRRQIRPTGSISQAINLAHVRIQGVEGRRQRAVRRGRLIWLPYAQRSRATYGTVLSGTSPLSGVSLAGEPQDNITPSKVAAGLRVGDRGDHWWVAYGLRTRDGSHARVAAADGLAVPDRAGSARPRRLHGAARRGRLRLAARATSVSGLTVSVDNLTDKFYREQFQFAPARGRSVSFAIHVKGLR